MLPLFRKSALNYQANQVWGSVSLITPVSYKVGAFVSVVFVIFLVLFIALVEFQRVEVLEGVIKSDKGVIKMYSPSEFVISEIWVNSGEMVKVGQPLMKLESYSYYSDNKTVEDETLKNSKAIINKIDQQIETVIKKGKIEKNALSLSIEKHKQKINFLEEEAKRLAERIEYLESTLSKYQLPKSQPYVSQDTIDLRRDRVLSLKQEYYLTKQNKEVESSLLLEQKALLEQTEVERAFELNDLKIKKADLFNQIIMTEGEANNIITATVDGYVSSIVPTLGQKLNKGEYLLSVLPKDTEFYAELYATSKSIGLIENGQDAYLKIQAFPYQKYGVVESTVSDISRFALLGEDIHLQSKSTETFFVVEAKLDEQRGNRQLERYSFMPGMKLSAEIKTDTQTIWDWLVRPTASH